MIDKQNMRRYFFHVSLNGHALMDNDGMQFATVADAMYEAEASARELLAAAIVADKDFPDMISVFDDHQQKVAEVSFRDLIPASLR